MYIIPCLSWICCQNEAQFQRVILGFVQGVGSLFMTKVQYDTTYIERVKCFLFNPKYRTNKPRRVIIYLHGGGWSFGSLSMFSKFMQTICDRLNCLIIYPEYKFSPEHPFPHGLNECCDVVKCVLNSPFLYGSNISIMGDSAGGNFAAVIAKRLAKDRLSDRLSGRKQKTLPKIVALIYPLLQVTTMSPPQDHIFAKSYIELFPKLVLWYSGVDKVTADWKNLTLNLLTTEKNLFGEIDYHKKFANSQNPENIQLSITSGRMNLINFMTNDEVSPLIQSDDDYELLANSGIRFHIQCAEHDQLWVEAKIYSDKLKKINKDCVVAFKRYDGCMHGWCMMGSSRGGSLPRCIWTKEYDDLIDVWLDEMDGLLM